MTSFPYRRRCAVKSDYLVGIPGVGLVAFEVKVKTVYGEGPIFDRAEVQKLRTFARLFRLTVYFACLDLNGGQQGSLVQLDQFDNVPAVKRAGVLTLCMPIAHAIPVSLAKPFYTVFVRAVAPAQ